MRSRTPQKKTAIALAAALSAYGCAGTAGSSSSPPAPAGDPAPGTNDGLPAPAPAPGPAPEPTPAPAPAPEPVASALPLVERTSRVRLCDFEDGRLPLPSTDRYGFVFFVNNAYNAGIYTWAVDATRGAAGTSRSLRFDVTHGYPYFYWLSNDDAAKIAEARGANRFEFYVSAPPGWLAGKTFQNFNIGTYLRADAVPTGNETNNMHHYFQLNLDFQTDGWMHVVVGGNPVHQRDVSNWDPGCSSQRPYLGRFWEGATRFYLCGYPNPDAEPGVGYPYSMWFDELAFYYQNDFVVASPGLSRRRGLAGETVYHAATITNTHPLESRRYGLFARGPYDSVYTWATRPAILADANGDGRYQAGEDTIVTETPLLAPGASFHVLVRDPIPAAAAPSWPAHRTTLMAWQIEPAPATADPLARNTSEWSYRGYYDGPCQSALLLTSVGAAVADAEAPAAIADLALASIERESAGIAWTAPADAPSGGPAMAYEIRLSLFPITDDASWARATPFPDAPPPAAPGTRQTYIVPGLKPGTTYYAAIRALDEAGNRSAVSNTVEFATRP
jgi:hypothetical protein